MLFAIHSIVIFIIISTNNAVSAEDCDAGWTYFEGKCYKVFPELVTFEEAKKQCEAVKANLVSIGSEAENQFVLLEASNWSNLEILKPIWLGLVLKRDLDGKLNGASWLDGTSPSAFGDPLKGTDKKSGNKPWKDPDSSHTTGNCVLWTYYINVTWMLRNCDDKNNYMCEKDYKVVSAPTCEDGWASFEGKCYKVFLDFVSYEVAKNRCKAVQANLVDIASERENNFVGMKLNSSSIWKTIWLGLELKRNSSGKVIGASWQDGTSISGYGDPVNCGPLDCMDEKMRYKPWEQNPNSPFDICQLNSGGNCAKLTFWRSGTYAGKNCPFPGSRARDWDSRTALMGGTRWEVNDCDQQYNYMCKKNGRQGREGRELSAI